MTAPSGASEPRRIARPPSDTSGFERADDVVVEDLGARESLRDGQPGDGQDVVQVEAGHQAAQAAGLEEVLHQVLAGRADVGEDRDGAGELVEAVQGRASTPARPAIAIRWMTALVEPPSARTTVIAFSKDSRESGDAGRSTIRRPAATAMRGWSESRGRDRGGARQRQAQRLDRGRHRRRRPHRHAVAGRGGDPLLDLLPVGLRDSPARSSAQYFQTSEPEPSVSPRQRARSIGPARHEDERQAGATPRP